MQVKLEQPGCLGEVTSFLSSCDCVVRQTAVDVLDIGFDPPEASLDRTRLEAYLGIWNMLHPSAGAALLDDAGVAA